MDFLRVQANLSRTWTLRWRRWFCG